MVRGFIAVLNIVIWGGKSLFFVCVDKINVVILHHESKAIN